jgi:hypothetical protein
MTSVPSVAETNATLTAPGQMFEMDTVSIRGIPTRVWKNAPPSLRAVLEMSRGYGDKTFLVYEDERATFEEHYARAAALAHQLIDRYGVEKGDRVAIAMRNFPEWVVAFWAAAATGAVMVPLNAWWTGPELEYGLADSGAKVLVADGQRLERIAPHLDALTALTGLIGVRLAEEGETWKIPDGVDDFAPLASSGPAELPDVSLGHDRPPQRRGRHPPQHLWQLDESCLHQRAGGGSLVVDDPGGIRGSGAGDTDGVPAVCSSVSCDRLSQHPHGQHRLRGQAGDDAQVGPRPGAGPD